MTRMKAQAFEILQDIPDDKITHVIELLRGVRGLYGQSEKPAAQEGSPDSAMGIFNKYANPDLIPLEKEAWGMAVMEKHGIR